MTEREYYRRFDNLSKKELHKKIIKKFMSEMMLWQLLLNAAEVKKTRGIRTNDVFRNKLMIPDSEIPKCPEFEVKSKIGKIFKKHNPVEEYFVRIYETDLYFYEHYENK